MSGWLTSQGIPSIFANSSPPCHIGLTHVHFDLLAQALAQPSIKLPSVGADRGSAELHYLGKMFEAGAFKLEAPRTLRACSPTFAAGVRSACCRGQRAARPMHWRSSTTRVPMTFAELDEAAYAVANGLLAMGVKGATGWRSWRATTAGS